MGATIGTAAGGVIGSVIPVAGTAAGMAIGGSVGGFVGGAVGGMIGCAVATQAFQTEITYEPGQTEQYADIAKTYAVETIENVKAFAPDKVADITESINSFAAANSLPFKL